MAYDYTLTRTNMVSNTDGLLLNKRLASLLINTFEGITSLNSLESITIDNDSAYPESHFQLECTLVDFGFFFNFWKQDIIIEISSEQDPSRLFKLLKEYSKTIISNGFKLLDPTSEITTLDIGMEKHLIEYTGFGEIVKQVKRNANTNNI